ncbi:hypothetical protein [Sulfobacillus sp. hq2]|uniref:hypothetical protein n=1 Tax=Sulfobacillus TaxID=28033 RepID=UPI000CD32C66|nr:hypothetical protein [Sulfobacillus sp. hq2]POB09686.1 hypothetical protein CO251_15905 [Sulfobacillus sp. hq2]
MKYKHSPIAPRVPQLVLLAGGLAVSLGFAGGMAFAASGIGTVATGGTTITSKISPVTGTGALLSNSVNQNHVSLGRGPFEPLNPHGPNGSKTAGAPPGSVPPTLPAGYVTITPVTPWYFNGCMPNPPVSVVAPNSDVGFTGDTLAPGEPGWVARIAPPSQNALVIPFNAPKNLPGGSSLAGYPAQPAPVLWGNMEQLGAVGVLIPGPGWGIESQELQKWWHYLVTTKDGITWDTVADGSPYWVAREVYYVNACPYPIVTITSN